MHSTHETPGADLAHVDLNLLRVLDVLLSEGSATAAARRLGVTQSAVSHALGRLRALTGDPLLVRGGRGLVPTPRGAAMRDPVHRALGELGAALAPALFDPRTARATFVVACPDYTAMLLGPRLAVRLAREATEIELVLAAAVGDPHEALATSACDLVVGSGTTAVDGDGLYQQRLFDDGFDCVVARDHPRINEPWDLDLYCELRHVLIAPRGTAGGPVDTKLEALGRKRKVSVRVASFVGACYVAAGSDAVLTLPSRLARALAPTIGLALRPPPLELASFAIVQQWHARKHADPLHRWMRALVADASQALAA